MKMKDIGPREARAPKLANEFCQFTSKPKMKGK